MTRDDQFERLYHLLAQVRELKPEQRERVLADACGGDEDLLAELTACLHATEQLATSSGAGAESAVDVTPHEDADVGRVSPVAEAVAGMATVDATAQVRHVSFAPAVPPDDGDGFVAPTELPGGDEITREHPDHIKEPADHARPTSTEVQRLLLAESPRRAPKARLGHTAIAAGVVGGAALAIGFGAGWVVGGLAATGGATPGRPVGPVIAATGATAVSSNTDRHASGRASSPADDVWAPWDGGDPRTSGSLLDPGVGLDLATWDGPFAALAISGDGARFLGVRSDGTVALGECSSGDSIDAWCLPDTHGTVTAACLDERGAAFAVGLADGSILIGGDGLGDPVPSPGVHEGAVTALAPSPDGQGFISGGLDGQVLHLPLTTDACVDVIGTQAPVFAVATDPVTGLVAAAGADGRVHVHHPRLNQSFLLDAELGPVTALGFDSTGGTLAAAGSSAVAVWSPDERRLLALVPGVRSVTHGVAFTTPDRLVVAGTWALDVIDLELMESVDSVPVNARVGALSDDGTLLITDRGDGYGAGGLVVHDPSVHALRSAEPVVTSALALGPERLLRGHADGTISIGRPGAPGSRRVDAHRGAVTGLAGDVSGRWIATAGTDGLARLWDFDSGRCARTHRTDPGAAIALSDDGQLLAIGNAGGCEVRDTTDGRLGAYVALDGAALRPPVEVAFLPDCGGLLTLEASGRLARWDLDGVLLGDLACGLDVRGMTVAPDGAFVAVFSGRGEVLVTDPAFSTATRLGRHEGSVLSAAFVQDGAVLLTGAADGQLRAFDVRQGRLLGAVRPFGGAPVETVTPFLEGGRLLVGSAGETLALDLPTPRVGGLNEAIVIGEER